MPHDFLANVQYPEELMSLLRQDTQPSDRLHKCRSQVKFFKMSVRGGLVAAQIDKVQKQRSVFRALLENFPVPSHIPGKEATMLRYFSGTDCITLLILKKLSKSLPEDGAEGLVAVLSAELSVLRVC